MGHLRQIKKGGWCWQEKAVMRLIRDTYQGKRLTTAIAIYQSLTEMASNQGDDIFFAFNKQIADFSGKSISTVKNYCSSFISLGLLEKRTRKHDGKINLSNEWKLLTPSVSNNYPTSDQDTSSTSVNNDQPLKEEIILEEDNKKALSSPGYKKTQEFIDRLRRNSHA